MSAADLVTLGLTVQYGAIIAWRMIAKHGLKATFGYHPLLMTAHFCLTVFGIVVSQNFHIHTKAANPAKVLSSMRNRHASLQMLSTAASVLGFAAIYITQMKSGGKHFLSFHSQTGMLALLANIAQAMLGYSLGTRIQKKQPLPTWLRPVHRLLGYITFCMLWGAQVLAVLRGYTTYHLPGTMLPWLIGSLTFILVGILSGIRFDHDALRRRVNKRGKLF